MASRGLGRGWVGVGGRGWIGGRGGVGGMGLIGGRGLWRGEEGAHRAAGRRLTCGG